MSSCSSCGSERKSLGEVSIDTLREQGMDEALIRKIQAISDKRRNAMAAPDTLGLPYLLEQRRLEFGIPDDAFSVYPYVDRILVWQMAKDEGKPTFGDTQIFMPDNIADQRQSEAPRGILLAAGLEARIRMETNGIELGHMVIFIQAAPFMLRTGWTGATENRVIILQSGDLVGSEDLRAEVLSGRREEIIEVPSDGSEPYMYLEGGSTRNVPHPIKPVIDEHPADY